MNVTLLSLNSQYVHSTLAPWRLLAAINEYCKENVTVRVEERTVNEPLENVLNGLSKTEPAVIGISCYIWNITFVRKLLPAIKKKWPNVFIVLGGPEVSYNAESITAEYPEVDCVVTGEGERTIVKIIELLCSNSPVPKILQGIREDNPPSPYTPEYIATLKNRIAYLETTRGCPYRCAFCLSGAERGVRCFPLERSKKELVTLACSGAKVVKLVDRTFNAQRERSYELLFFLIENTGRLFPENVRFHFEAAGDIFDERTLRLLETAPGQKSRVKAEKTKIFFGSF